MEWFFNVILSPLVLLFITIFNLHLLLRHTLYIFEYLDLAQKKRIKLERNSSTSGSNSWSPSNVVHSSFVSPLYLQGELGKNYRYTCFSWNFFSSIPFWDADMFLMDIRICFSWDEEMFPMTSKIWYLS